MTPSAVPSPQRSASALRRRRRRHRFAATFLAASFLAVTLVPGANAFDSTYCGHNTSPGYGSRVVYKHPVQVGAIHYHRYKHQIQFVVWTTVHERNHQCPSAPHGN
jgi:hypothetical protein